jgi:formylglycine-generating enzyme required for sulfatase activity
MKRTILVVGVLLAVANVASATIKRTFGTGINEFTLDFVTIGNPGNPGDTRTDYPNSADPYGCGAVDYEYQIGKYEITNIQWDAFTSAAGTPTGNDGGYSNNAYWTGDNIPTSNVSWYEAAQFCNYLTSGDKNLGAYQWSGNNTNPGDFEGIDRDSAVSTYGITYVIPTEDEWYKAAYYTGSGYSTYANGTDTAPIEDVDSNYGWESGAQPWDVGSGTEEQNGTYDMMGNVWECNETLVHDFYRGLRGTYCEGADEDLRSSGLFSLYPHHEDYSSGFRVASVPEPCSLVLLGFGGLLLRRKKR